MPTGGLRYDRARVRSMVTATGGPAPEGSAGSKILVLVSAGGRGRDVAAAAARAAVEAGDVAVVVLPRATDDLRPRDHLPRTIFETPKLGDFAAILECRPTVEASQAFSRLCKCAAAAGLECLAGYVVDETIVLDGPRYGGDPKSNHSVKMVSIGRWGTQVVAAEAALHWRNIHGPLALRHHVGMSRYVQNVVVDRLWSASKEVELIAELWFANTADFIERPYDSPEGRRTIAADAKSFSGGGDTHFCVEMAVGHVSG